LISGGKAANSGIYEPPYSTATALPALDDASGTQAGAGISTNDATARSQLGGTDNDPDKAAWPRSRRTRRSGRSGVNRPTTHMSAILHTFWMM
jgi:hypothetical protein